MSFARAASVGCGAVLACFGATITGGAALSFGEEGATLGDLVMMLLFGLLPFALGTYWVTQVLKAHRKEAWEALEREVLSYAMRKGGVVTALEIAAHTNLSYDEVKRYLDGLADKGHIEVTPTDNGLAYRFPGADTNPGAPLWSPPSTEAPHLPNRTSE
ncbi:MAG TPA: hypothetical protein PLJ31_02800 [Armatimonadota bacterium]|nr:hypothetical protein [Armatimonadota bacterium]